MRPRPYLVSLLSDNIGAGVLVVLPTPCQSGSPPLIGFRSAVAPGEYRLEYVAECFERERRATRRLERLRCRGDVEGTPAPGATGHRYEGNDA